MTPVDDARDDLRAEARSHLRRAATVQQATADTCADAVVAAARVIAGALAGGGKVLLCGNGGSAADCQHVAAELMSRFRRDVDRPALAAIALTTDTSFLTAFANDLGFEGVFARQVEGLGRRGDVLVAISTSGGSANVVRAIETARGLGVHVVALTGAGGRIAALADVAIAVPSNDTQHVQEAHLAVEHALCGLVERLILADPSSGARLT